MNKKERAKLAKINRINRENNKRFRAASRAERRVLIAQDIIDRIRVKQFKPETGVWAHVDGIGGANSKDSVQTIINGGSTCECCAVGGMLLSCIAFKNRVTVNDVEEKEALSGNEVLGYGDWGNRDKTGLKKLFGQQQLSVIEYCFEDGQGVASQDDLPSSKIDRIQDYCGNLPGEPDKRMLVIMKNIIDNNGTFKP